MLRIFSFHILLEILLKQINTANVSRPLFEASCYQLKVLGLWPKH